MTIKQTITGMIILWALLSCENTNQEGNPSRIKNESSTQVSGIDSSKNGWKYKKVKQIYIDSLMLDVCSTQDLEFIDLYPTLDSIASDSHERLVLVDSLKSIGFEVTNWGRGNWMNGPRMINFTLSNQQCECYVDKLYYTTDDQDIFNVTERIKCKKSTPLSNHEFY